MTQAGIEEFEDFTVAPAARTGSELDLDGSASSIKGTVKLNDHDSFPTPGETSFGSWDYQLDSLLGLVKSQLIMKHADLKHLEGRAVDVFWRKKASKSKGKIEIGGCMLPSGLLRQMMDGVDFVIWLAADACKGMTRREIEAALYEQLLHAGIDKDGNRVYRGYDVSMFASVLKHYGAVTPEQRKVGVAFQQLPMILEDQQPALEDYAELVLDNTEDGE